LISHKIDVQTDLNQPLQLLPIFRERVWGREDLRPFFTQMPPNQRIGEVWFTFRENATSADVTLGELLARRPEILGRGADPEYPGVCPLLVKLLFTTERLSVQVHPDDEYARQYHDSLGKTEAWYVVDAQPPGEVAVGFRETITPERLKETAQSGEIETLLDWRKVRPGDAIFTPAGTVHAIGAGLTICEIQENSDITYRLYDYGRPRELHLEHGVKVSHLGPHNFDAAPVKLADGRDELVACEYFRIERLRPKNEVHIDRGTPYYLLLICLKGSGTIAGEPFAAGQCWMVPSHHTELILNGPGSEWIATYKAAEPLAGLHIK